MVVLTLRSSGGQNQDKQNKNKNNRKAQHSRPDFNIWKPCSEMGVLICAFLATEDIQAEVI